MSVTWTKEQQQVIDLSDRNILVSAAAGSGKTAVLVERIIQKLIRDKNPVSVDELLIVTFTEAAAAEMKDRIRNAIEKKLEEYPENEHLRQQATLIHNAQITTIHSFCLSVIREHFHKIDLDPGFRIGEDGELKLLRHDVLTQVLESYYEEGNPEFLDFVEAYADGRDDRKLEELILKIYEFSRSHPDSEEWLQNCVAAYQIDSVEDLEQTTYFAYTKEHVYAYMESALELVNQGLAICQEPDGPYMYASAFESDSKQIEKIHEAQSYKEFYEAAQGIAWARLAPNKDKTISEEKTARAKEIREELKKLVKDVAEQYFSQSPEMLVDDMKRCAPMVSVLVELTSDFAKTFEETKRSRNLIDFDDMEQYALRILVDKTENGFVPSKVAKEYQEQFSEVMIDEYQDSNLIQETILTSVSRMSVGKNNVFMVGDVKQSIYRFRLSRPELFMHKYDTYTLEESDTQRIDLHKNFRSRREVLDSVNFLFEQIMKKDLGGITYDENAALNVGASYEPVSGNETEVIMMCSKLDEEVAGKISKGEMLSPREMEARAVAGEIKRLMEVQQVTDKKSGQLRPVRYSDIVILTRSVKGFSDVFSDVLMKEGIPVYVGTKEGYFETQEIGVLLDYLSVLNNQRQDIPLAAVLRSYFGNMTDEELAIIKNRYPEKRFYQAVKEFAAEGIQSEEEFATAQIQEKLNRCLNQINHFRQMVAYTSIHELLWKIMNETGYDDYVSALPGGEQRKANVEMLVEKAVAFESTSYKGLFNFIRYIEQLKKYEVDYGEANIEDEQADTVRIMSIHKSKGLEFPVVIVAGMGKLFNMQDARSSVLVHAELGIGLDSVDIKSRIKVPSFLKKVIQKEEELETLGEELRVLYVALTRAKEKLLVTGTMTKLPDMETLGGTGKTLMFGQLSRATKYWDWIIPALANRTKEGPIIVRMMDLQDVVSEEVQEETVGVFTRKALEDWDTSKVYDEEMHQMLKEQFGYQYPYDSLLDTKIKFTVSELKKREYLDEEAGEFLIKEEPVIPLIPKFLQEQEELTGASRGSAYHRVFELLDFTREYDEEKLAQEIEHMRETGRLSQEYAACIVPSDIQEFLCCESGRRMQAAAKNGMLYKEQPFVLGIPMEEVYPELQKSDLCEKGLTETGLKETVLVQGIIDVYFEEDGELVVLDYKTDKVFRAGQLVERYHAQLEYYARALEQITGKKVKEKIIYSVTLNKEIHF